MIYRPRQHLWPVSTVLLALLTGLSFAAETLPADRQPTESPGAAVAVAPPASQPDVRRGGFLVKFTQRNELSPLPAMFKRYGRKPARQVADYELAAEPFKVIVPEAYDPQTPFGVVVFVSPADGDEAMGDLYAPVLAKRKLIFVGALNGGNNREVWHRLALALDGLGNIQQRYNIDRERQYVSGMSGGGRIASRLGILYADVFTGAFPLCGCDYYRDIPVPGDPTKMWRRLFAPPARPVLRLAKRSNRYVLLTGETDGNRLQTKGIYRLYERDRFEHVTYLEVPGMGHEYPPPDWFDQGLAALDAPLATGQKAPDRRAGLATPARSAAPGDSAHRRLILAKRYLRAGADKSARKQLQIVIDEYAGTSEAVEAKRLLQELSSE